ncbi:uncharacterized protein LOC142768289 [Rhipicephalus microplus]|uniref:uncharacterized protein LOC142768289 n=1 Tax=Rhipicephalus microplus TaxID=6941 RepID=UPI003F6AC0E8
MAGFYLVEMSPEDTPHLSIEAEVVGQDCNVIGEAEPTVGLFVHQDADELCKSGAPLVQHTEERDENLDLGLSERHCDEEAPSLDSSSLGNAGRVLENVNNPVNGVEEFAVCQDKHETVSNEFPRIGETVTSASHKHLLTIINSAPLLGGKSAGQPTRVPLLRMSRPKALHDSTNSPLLKGKPAELRSRVPLLRTPATELPRNTFGGSPTRKSSLQRRRPAGDNYNLRTSSVPSPHPKVG